MESVRLVTDRRGPTHNSASVKATTERNDSPEVQVGAVGRKLWWSAGGGEAAVLQEDRHRDLVVPGVTLSSGSSRHSPLELCRDRVQGRAVRRAPTDGRSHRGRSRSHRRYVPDSRPTTSAGPWV